MTIYVDVLVILNYVITALLLEATAKLLGRSPKRARLVIAALLGAFCSLIIFMPNIGFWGMMSYRFFTSAGIIAAAFGAKKAAFMFKAWLMFFAVSFFFAGAMLGVIMLLSPREMLYYNGVVYYHLNPVTLLCCTVIAYILLGLLRRFSRAGRIPQARCRASLMLGSRSVLLDALVDSGNSLYEPFSGAPVIVAPLGSLKRLFPPELYKALTKGDIERSAKAAKGALRIIPYKVVDGGGTLPAIRLDGLMVEHKGKKRRAELVYLAVSQNSINSDGCAALLNPDLAYCE